VAATRDASAARVDGLTRRAGASSLLLGVTVVLTSLSLRSPVTSIGALLRDIQADLAMSDTMAGVLTMLPPLSFGVFGLLAGALTRRFGTARVLVGALVLMSVGLLARAVSPDTTSLIALTLVTLVGMALGNVLVPVAVKSWFPERVGRMTGLYSTALMTGTAIAAAATVPIATALGGWRVGLAIWAVPAVAALVPWALARRRTPVGQPLIDDAVAAEIGFEPVADDEIVRRVRRSPQAWGLTVFFGIQGFEAYVVMGWLTAILQDAGVSPARAGVLLGITMGIGIPFALIIPPFAARGPDQRGWVIGLAIPPVVAYFGLLFAPAAAPLVWSVLLGLGLATFPLALLLIGLRARTSAGTSAMSSLVQGIGYLVAVTGPFTVGFLRDVTDAWTVPLIVLLVLIVPRTVGGMVAARPGHVDDLREGRS
jgi:MFS transporter, CP family, cyanate transporter